MTRRFRTAHCPVPGCDRGRGTRGHHTRHPDDDRCLPHRAQGHMPVGDMSKADLDEMLRDQVCLGGEPR